jgi:DNA-binding transcriptional regulator/RsmH inhibitor MraZ
MAEKATEVIDGKSETPLGMLNNCDTSSLDDKGRARLPNRFRSMMGERIHIFYQGLSGVLRVMGPVKYKEFDSKSQSRFSDENGDGLLYRQMLINSAREIVIDSSDRIMIPSELRQAAEIGPGKIYILNNGEGDFSIYTEAAYKEFNDNPFEFRAGIRKQIKELFKSALSMEQDLMSISGKA